MFEEVRVNELTDMKQKGILVAGTGAGTLKLSAKGLTEYDRIMESLSAKEQVIIALKVLANAEQTEAAVKALMK